MTWLKGHKHHREMCAQYFVKQKNNANITKSAIFYRKENLATGLDSIPLTLLLNSFTKTTYFFFSLFQDRSSSTTSSWKIFQFWSQKKFFDQTNFREFTKEKKSIKILFFCYFSVLSRTRRIPIGTIVINANHDVEERVKQMHMKIVWHGGHASSSDWFHVRWDEQIRKQTTYCIG